MKLLKIGCIMIGASMLACALQPTTAVADSMTDEFSREGKWEGYVFGQAGFSSLLDGMEGVGIAIGYNAKEHLNVNCELSLSTVEIDILFGPDETETVWSGTMSLDYNILKTRFTPYFTAGVGYVFTDKESSPTADVGVGFRYDATDRIVLKAAFRPTWWLDAEDDDVFYLISIGVGYKF